MGRMKHTPTPWSLAHKTDGTPVITKITGNTLQVVACCDLHKSVDLRNANRIIQCVNALEGFEDPIKMRETWDVVKELELDSFHKLKQEHDQFIELVRAMRDNQKEYFRNRTRESLLQSKELERQVDLLLIPTDKRIQQTELFNK